MSIRSVSNTVHSKARITMVPGVHVNFLLLCNKSPPSLYLILTQFFRSEVWVGLTDFPTLSPRRKKSRWWTTWALIWRLWGEFVQGNGSATGPCLSSMYPYRPFQQRLEPQLIWALAEWLWSSQNRRGWGDYREPLWGHFPLDLSSPGGFHNTVA